MASNILVGFLIAVFCSVMLDAVLIFTGHMKAPKGHYYHMSNMPTTGVNSSTGLPMANSRLDVSGNPYGGPRNEINPATGLPMLDDSIDVGGNMYGTSSSDFHSNDNNW